MKKILTGILLISLSLFALTACGTSAQTAEQTPAAETQTGSAQTAVSEKEPTGSVPDSTGKTNTDNSHALVAYFSLAGEQYKVGVIDEGNTAVIAKMIAEETDADLFSIDPVDAYPEDYEGKLDAAREEQSSNARPAFIGEVENWEDYDTVFLGYPIWWGEIPNIVYTFMDNYDFSGKTVIPFCTHAGSGLSGTEQDIADTIHAELRDGLAVEGTTAQNDREDAAQQVHAWLEEVYPFR